MSEDKEERIPDALWRDDMHRASIFFDMCWLVDCNEEEFNAIVQVELLEGGD